GLADGVGHVLEFTLHLLDRLPAGVRVDLLGPHPFAFGAVSPAGLPQHGQVFLAWLFMVETHLHLVEPVTAEQVHARAALKRAEADAHRRAWAGGIARHAYRRYLRGFPRLLGG